MRCPARVAPSLILALGLGGQGLSAQDVRMPVAQFLELELTDQYAVVVVMGRVRVDVVVMGAVVMVGGGGGAMVVTGVEVASGAVPVPATGGSVNAFTASSTLTG